MQSFRGQTRFCYGKCVNGECKFSPKLFQKSRIAKAAVTLIWVSQRFGHPIPKPLVVIWTSPSHITLAIWVRVTVRVGVRVTWDAHITRVLEMGMPISL